MVDTVTELLSELQCWGVGGWSLLRWPRGILLCVGCDGDGALVELHLQTDPVPRSHLQRLLQHRRRLLPVGVVAESADADFRVQVDVVPERNGCYSPCMCGLDLQERDCYFFCVVVYQLPMFLAWHLHGQFTKKT